MAGLTVQRGRLEMQRSAVQRDIDQLTEQTDSLHSLHRQIAGLEGEKHTLTGPGRDRPYVY
jgi:hypothetical protein